MPRSTERVAKGKSPGPHHVPCPERPSNPADSGPRLILPLAYEVLAGNTQDKATLRDFLALIERQYGKARRVWVMDRGIPTEEVLQEMRNSDPPIQYLVGTPKGRLTSLEQQLLTKSWQEARPACR